MHANCHLVADNDEVLWMTYATRNVMAVPPASPLITTIEWEMLDKRRFYPLSMMSRFLEYKFGVFVEFSLAWFTNESFNP